MRMWMLPPRMMCQKHILGEHGEIHKHRHNFVKGHSITGRLGQIDPLAMQTRHDELALYIAGHKSPYLQPDLSGYDLHEFVVSRFVSICDLCSRCGACRELIRRELMKLAVARYEVSTDTNHPAYWAAGNTDNGFYIETPNRSTYEQVNLDLDILRSYGIEVNEVGTCTGYDDAGEICE